MAHSFLVFVIVEILRQGIECSNRFNSWWRMLHLLVVHSWVEGLPGSSQKWPTVATAMWTICLDSKETSFCLVWCPIELLIELHVLQQRQNLLCFRRRLATLGRWLALDEDILYCFQLQMPLLLIVFISQLQTLLRQSSLLELLLVALHNIFWMNSQKPADVQRIRCQESISLCSSCFRLAIPRLED